MKKIGICFGGYCPMHRGHLDAIMRAKKENDVCFVAVCGYDNQPRANEIKLNLDKRFQLVKEFFKDDEIINVIKINDTELGIDQSMSLSNWKIWLTAVKNNILNSSDEYDEGFHNTEITIYVGEVFYCHDLEKLIKDGWFNREFFLYGNGKINWNLVPKSIPISGTLVRSNPLKYWDKIVPTFRPYLTKNILVIGTASEGKTTLVRDIAKYFNIPHIEEYGRTYMAERNMLDTDLTCHDFVEFLIHQRQDLLDAERSDANNKGVIISDTDNFITLMYAMAYSEDNNINFTQEEFESLKKLVKEHLSKGIYWDRIFVIPPGNKFVDDGTRYMKQSSMDERVKNYNNLLHLIEEICPEYINKMVELAPSEYYYNFERVKKYIEHILN